MGSTAETTIIDSGIIEYAIFIVLLPMLAFPVILFLGHIFNGTTPGSNPQKRVDSLLCRSWSQALFSRCCSLLNSSGPVRENTT